MIGPALPLHRCGHTFSDCPACTIGAKRRLQRASIIHNRRRENSH